METERARHDFLSPHFILTTGHLCQGFSLLSFPLSIDFKFDVIPAGGVFISILDGRIVPVRLFIFSFPTLSIVGGTVPTAFTSLSSSSLVSTAKLKRYPLTSKQCLLRLRSAMGLMASGKHHVHVGMLLRLQTLHVLHFCVFQLPVRKAALLLPPLIEILFRSQQSIYHTVCRRCILYLFLLAL